MYTQYLDYYSYQEAAALAAAGRNHRHAPQRHQRQQLPHPLAQAWPVGRASQTTRVLDGWVLAVVEERLLLLCGCCCCCWCRKSGRPMRRRRAPQQQCPSAGGTPRDGEASGLVCSLQTSKGSHATHYCNDCQHACILPGNHRFPNLGFKSFVQVKKSMKLRNLE